MRIGVVVTVYNVQDYIRQCLTSIINQDYKKLEIVIVDDGSTDDSSFICDEFAQLDNRIKVIHQKNQGPTIARLNGVRALRSEFVSFVDGDDWISDNLYSDIFESGILDGNDVISFGIIRYYGMEDSRTDADNFRPGVYRRFDIENKMLSTIFWNNADNTYGLDPSLCSKIIKRTLLVNALEQVSRLDIHYGEDIAVIYTMLDKIDSLYILPDAYYYHRQRKNNVVAGYFTDADYFKKLFMLYSYLEDKFQGMAQSKELIKQLDYFYIYSVEFGKLKYNDITFEKMYLFPFDRVKAGSKIVLYGAGRVGHTFYKQIGRIHFCEVICWVDYHYDIYCDSTIQPPDVIRNIIFDSIVIAIESKTTSQEVKRYLMDMGIDEAYIITI